MRVEVRPFEDEFTVQYAKEIPFPGEVPLSRWFSKDAEVNQRQLLRSLGYRQAGAEWTLEGVRDVADFIAIAPCQLTLQVTVYPDEDRVLHEGGRFYYLGPLPEVYFARIPGGLSQRKDPSAIWNPFVYFGQQQVERVPLVWDPGEGVFRGVIHTLVADPGSSALPSPNSSILSSPFVTFGVFALEKGVGGKTVSISADFVRGRLLWPKIYPDEDSLPLLRRLVVPVVLSVLREYLDELGTIYLDDPDRKKNARARWQAWLESAGLPPNLSAEDVIKGARSIVESPEFQAGLEENLRFAVSGRGYYRSGFEALMSGAVSALAQLLPALFAAGAKAAANRPEPLSPILSAIDRVLLGQTAYAIELPPNTRPLYDTSTSAIWEALSWAGYHLIPLAFFVTHQEGPEGQVEEVRWFIAAETTPSGDTAYGAYTLVEEDGKSVLYRLKVGELQEKDLLELVQLYEERLKRREVAPPAGKPEEPVVVTDNYMDTSPFSLHLAKAAATVAAAAVIARMYPEFVPRSDLFAFFSGKGEFLAHFVPSLLTGAPFIGITGTQLRALREVTGDFLDQFEEIFRPQLEAARRFLADLQPLAEKAKQSRPGELPPEEVFATLLGALACQQAQYLRNLHKPIWAQIPQLYGFTQVSRYTGLYSKLLPDVQAEYLAVRGPVWELWYTSLFELEPGVVQWASDVFQKLRSLALADLKTKEEVEEAVGYAHRVLGAPDIPRHPKLEQAALMVLRRWAPESSRLLSLEKERTEKANAAAYLVGRWLSSWVGVNKDHLIKALLEEGAKLVERSGLRGMVSDEEIHSALLAFAQEGVVFLHSLASSMRDISTLEKAFGTEAKQFFLELGEGADLDQLSTRLIQLSSLLPEQVEPLAQALARNLVGHATFFLGEDPVGLSSRVQSFVNNALTRIAHMDPAEAGLVGPQMTEEAKAQFLKRWPELIQEFGKRFLQNAVPKVLSAASLTASWAAFNQETLPTAAAAVRSKTIALIKGLLEEEVAATLKSVTRELMPLEPWQMARVESLLLYNLYGWLGYPPSEDWMEQHFGSPSPMPPFFGNWGHTEQRLLLRFGIAGVGAVLGALGSLLR